MGAVLASLHLVCCSTLAALAACDMRLSHHVDDDSLEAASAFMGRAWYRMRYGGPAT